MPRRVWTSAVARALVHQHKTRAKPTSISDRIRAHAEEKASAPECATYLARLHHDSNRVSSEILWREVDLIAICSKLGVSVEYKPLAVEGLLKETESGFMATVDSMAKRPRQRLTLAHEIGHLELYRATGFRQAFGHVASEERKSIEALEIEELCDHFATELIMPSAAWDSLITTEGLSLNTLMKLKSIFGVSITSAARRMVQLATFACGVIIWQATYHGEAISEIQPIRFWGSLRSGRDAAAGDIEATGERLVPGSPFYAFEKQERSAGKILVSLSGQIGSYLAQSDLIDKLHAITIIVPARLGWHHMFRRIDSARISDFQ